MGVHFRAPQNRKFGKFTESRVQTAGNRNIIYSTEKLPFGFLKDILSYSDMWSVTVLEY